ncbi:MAG: thiamine phosphate synthase [Pirellulaceae bacterium]|nr:thiamine phosphate synthase [Pirellulaceae bacterium]
MDERDQLATYRILDANFNRATEGLRVVEEYCRFALDDRHLTEVCKSLRHDLVAAMRALPATQLHAARETQVDVGKEITTSSEAQRGALAQVATASCKRVEQALRALEEYAKLVSAGLASQLEQLRYRSYTLAKACTIARDSQQRLAGARLYVLIDGGLSECAFVERVTELMAAGVDVLQLRDKQLDDRTLLARGRLLRRVLNETRSEWESGRGGEGENHEPTRPPLSPSPSLPLFVFNDRPDLALLARADGVHVGQEELSVRDVRQIVGPEMLVGVSTHSIEQARQAVLDGANYLGCGPTFPSDTKEFEHFPGVDFLRQVAGEISLPAFAIGGITRQNLPDVLATGFTRVAVSGAIAGAEDIPAAAMEFNQLLRMNFPSCRVFLGGAGESSATER